MKVTQEQFTVIVNETKNIVLSAIRTNLFERYSYAVDDVAQEVYLRAFRVLVRGKFREESKLSTWLHVIARNESLRMNSKMGREEKKKEGLFSFLKFNHHEEDAENKMNNVELVRNKLDLLPDEYRDVVMMHYEGRSESEIGEKLSIPKGTVKSRVHRGKKLMRELIAGTESGGR